MRRDVEFFCWGEFFKNSQSNTRGAIVKDYRVTLKRKGVVYVSIAENAVETKQLIDLSQQVQEVCNLGANTRLRIVVGFSLLSSRQFVLVLVLGKKIVLDNDDFNELTKQLLGVTSNDAVSV